MSEIEIVGPSPGPADAGLGGSPAALPVGISGAQAWQLAQRIARTEFVPAALRGKPESVLAAILFGRELGIGPMQSLQAIHVIEGRPGASPELMRALVARAGHRIDLESAGDEAVTLRGERADTGATATVTWSLADAERAGLIQIKDGRPWARSSSGKRLPWEQYPRAMLTARATAELCRVLFPDVISGLSYTVEELQSLGPLDAPPVIDWGALGWTGQAEHDRERERVRTSIGELDDDVRVELRARWDERGLAWPLSRDQLADWDATVEGIVAQHEAIQPDEKPVAVDRSTGEIIDTTVTATADHDSDGRPGDATPTPATLTRSKRPRVKAPPGLVAELRATATAAGLADDDVLEVMEPQFGARLAAIDDMTQAQAHATIEILRSLARPPEGAT
jgi:hypothetical protein